MKTPPYYPGRPAVAFDEENRNRLIANNVVRSGNGTRVDCSPGGRAIHVIPPRRAYPWRPAAQTLHWQPDTEDAGPTYQGTPINVPFLTSEPTWVDDPMATPEENAANQAAAHAAWLAGAALLDTANADGDAIVEVPGDQVGIIKFLTPGRFLIHYSVVCGFDPTYDGVKCVPDAVTKLLLKAGDTNLTATALYTTHHVKPVLKDVHYGTTTATTEGTVTVTLPTQIEATVYPASPAGAVDSVNFAETSITTHDYQDAEIDAVQVLTPFDEEPTATFSGTVAIAESKFTPWTPWGYSRQTITGTWQIVVVRDPADRTQLKIKNGSSLLDPTVEFLVNRHSVEDANPETFDWLDAADLNLMLHSGTATFHLFAP